VFRRRRLDPELQDPTELTDAFGRTFADDIEGLDLRIQAVDARLTQIEARVASALGVTELLPDHSDVLDVQLRAAKLAAELHLVNLELDRLKATAGP
jgi:hypothetical protein